MGAPACARAGRLRDALADSAGVESIVVAFDAPLDVAAADATGFGPARDALASGSLDTVTLLVDDAGDAIVWQSRRPSLRQRFAGRFARPDLAALLETAKRAD